MTTSVLATAEKDLAAEPPLALSMRVRQAIQESLQLHYERCRLYHLWEQQIAFAVEKASVTSEVQQDGNPPSRREGSENEKPSTKPSSTILVMEDGWLTSLQDLVLTPLQYITIRLRQLQQEVREAVQQLKKHQREKTDSQSKKEDQAQNTQASPPGASGSSLSLSKKEHQEVQKGQFFVQWVEEVQKTERRHFEQLMKLGEVVSQHIAASFLRGDQCEACLYRTKYEWKLYEKEVRAAWEAEKRAKFLEEIEQKAALLRRCGCHHHPCTTTAAPTATTTTSDPVVPDVEPTLPLPSPPPHGEDHHPDEVVASLETSTSERAPAIPVPTETTTTTTSRDPTPAPTSTVNHDDAISCLPSRPLFPQERACPHLSVHDLHSCTAYRLLQRWGSPLHAVPRESSRVPLAFSPAAPTPVDSTTPSSFSPSAQREREQQWLRAEADERQRRHAAWKENPWAQRLRCVECVEAGYHARIPRTAECDGSNNDDDDEVEEEQYVTSKKTKESIVPGHAIRAVGHAASAVAPISEQTAAFHSTKTTAQVLANFPRISIALPEEERPLYALGEEQEGEAEDHRVACEAARKRTLWCQASEDVVRARHQRHLRALQKRLQLGRGVRPSTTSGGHGGKGIEKEEVEDVDLFSSEEEGEDDDVEEERNIKPSGEGPSGRRKNPYPNAMATFHPITVRNRCTQASSIMNPLLSSIQSTVVEVMELVEDLQCQLYDDEEEEEL